MTDRRLVAFFLNLLLLRFSALYVQDLSSGFGTYILDVDYDYFLVREFLILHPDFVEFVGNFIFYPFVGLSRLS